MRTLADADFQDGVLSRNDMIGIFQQVEQAGPVDVAEFADLKAIVSQTSLFGDADYVQNLSSDVILGNSANAHYQGQPLGNLVVGSSATQLDDLVGKWFLGTDHPLGTSDWGPTYAYQAVAGQLFVNGPSYSDVRQGGVGGLLFSRGFIGNGAPESGCHHEYVHCEWRRHLHGFASTRAARRNM